MEAKQQQDAKNMIQQQDAKITKYLANQMMINTRTEEDIQALRTAACVQINIQGNNTELLSIEGLESRFYQQQDVLTKPRVCVPSTDILEWKAKFPLIKTCDDTLEDMRRQYTEMFEDGEDKIKQKESAIEAVLKLLDVSLNAQEIANKIADIVEDTVIIGATCSSSSPVKRKLQREIVDVLLKGSDKKKEI